MLIQQALFSVMSWSYAPLVGLGITAAAFAFKIPIEVSTVCLYTDGMESTCFVGGPYHEGSHRCRRIPCIHAKSARARHSLHLVIFFRRCLPKGKT